MTTEVFIRELVQLLARLDKGMLEFEDPPPEGVADGLIQAVLAFGEQALPALHAALLDEDGALHIIRALTSIGSPTSTLPLIEFHEHRCSYDSGLAAIQALRSLKTEPAYLYFAEQLSRYGRGDQHAFETRKEAVVACAALQEWEDQRAVAPLTLARGVDDDGYGIREAAHRALEAYGLGS